MSRSMMNLRNAIAPSIDARGPADDSRHGG
jgi:hypothetical protein